MGIRVAVASSDGIVVNMHFGQADHFYIFRRLLRMLLRSINTRAEGIAKGDDPAHIL